MTRYLGSFFPEVAVPVLAILDGATVVLLLNEPLNELLVEVLFDEDVNSLAVVYNLCWLDCLLGNSRLFSDLIGLWGSL